MWDRLKDGVQGLPAGLMTCSRIGRTQASRVSSCWKGSKVGLQLGRSIKQTYMDAYKEACAKNIRTRLRASIKLAPVLEDHGKYEAAGKTAPLSRWNGYKKCRVESTLSALTRDLLFLPLYSASRARFDESADKIRTGPRGMQGQVTELWEADHPAKE